MSNNTLYVTLFCFSLLFFCLCLEEANSLTGKGLSAEKNQLMVGDIPSGKPQGEGSMECENGLEQECEEGGKGDIDERIFEAGDYIYTNSNP